MSAIAAVQSSLQRQIEMNFKTKDTKYAKTLAIVMGFFIVLWLPYQLCIIMELVSDIMIDDWLRDYLFLLAYCNSGINPWIYAFRNKDFKRAFSDILSDWSHLCCKCGAKKDFDDMLPKPRSPSVSRGGSLVPSASSAVWCVEESPRRSSVITFDPRRRPSVQFIDQRRPSEESIDPRRPSVATLASASGIDIGFGRSGSSTLLLNDSIQPIPEITLPIPTDTFINVCQDSHSESDLSLGDNTNYHNNSYVDSDNGNSNISPSVLNGNGTGLLEVPSTTYNLFQVHCSQTENHKH